MEVDNNKQSILKIDIYDKETTDVLIVLYY